MIAAFFFSLYKLCSRVNYVICLFSGQFVVIQRITQALAELNDLLDSRFPKLKVSLLRRRFKQVSDNRRNILLSKIPYNSVHFLVFPFVELLTFAFLIFSRSSFHFFCWALTHLQEFLPSLPDPLQSLQDLTPLKSGISS